MKLQSAEIHVHAREMTWLRNRLEDDADRIGAVIGAISTYSNSSSSSNSSHLEGIVRKYLETKSGTSIKKEEVEK